MRFSPDGKLLFFFGDDVTVLETDELHRGGDVAATRSRPSPASAASTSVRSHDFYDAPGIVHRPLHDAGPGRRSAGIMGIGRVDLTARKVDFQPLGPARAGVRSRSRPTASAPTASSQDIGHYEFWTFDLEKNAVAERTEFEGRPRMGLRVSSQRQARLRLRRRRHRSTSTRRPRTSTCARSTLGGDQTTELFVVPGSATARGHVAAAEGG